MVLKIVLICALIAYPCQCQLYPSVEVKIEPGSSENVTGTLHIISLNTGIYIKGTINGLTPGHHGFHIHLSGDLGNECRAAGPHFNPFDKAHGSPDANERHVGDLGNIEANGKGEAIINIFDAIASLDPESTAYVGNRAIVVHANADDLGKGSNEGSMKTGNAGPRVGCGTIVEHPSAIVEIVPGSSDTIKGTLQITSLDSGVLIEGAISGLTPGLHGFHIHHSGHLGNECKDAGPHFNPFDKAHGSPEAIERHVGDMGNIVVNEKGEATINIFDAMASLDPESPAYIGHRAIVVHASVDDLGKETDEDSKKTGNAGARMGCGYINVEQKEISIIDHPSAIVEIVPGSNDAVKGTLHIISLNSGVFIKGTINGLTPGMHGFHIHHTGNLGNKCKDAGSHFNPFDKAHGSPDANERHVGDLGNIEANDKGEAIINIVDAMASLDPESAAYIGNRAIVVHASVDDFGKGTNEGSKKTGNAGARMGCGTIVEHPSAIVDMVSGSSDTVKGTLHITYLNSGVLIKGAISGLTPGLHGFHIHHSGNLGNECKDAGPHFNPYDKAHGSPYASERHVGDLGNIKANEKGEAAINIVDAIASLDPESTAYIGNRSIVVHASADDLGKETNEKSKNTGNAGARMSCGYINVAQKQISIIEYPSAIVEIVPGSSDDVKGTLHITSLKYGVLIKGTIDGLTPGMHGFHIHHTGKLENECKDAGPHFNPFNKAHGSPGANERHVGDLGNIVANDKGEAKIRIVDAMASLDPESTAYIGNRSIVVHAFADDLGKGINEESKKTGNAGARMGCGIINVEGQANDLKTSFSIRLVTAQRHFVVGALSIVLLAAMVR